MIFHKILYAILHLLVIGFFIRWSNESWYRQWKGGIWYRNRYFVGTVNVELKWERSVGEDMIYVECYK